MTSGNGKSGSCSRLYCKAGWSVGVAAASAAGAPLAEKFLLNVAPIEPKRDEKLDSGEGAVVGANASLALRLDGIAEPVPLAGAPPVAFQRSMALAVQFVPRLLSSAAASEDCSA